MSLRSSLDRMPPKMKLASVIGAAVAVAVGGVWLAQPQTSVKEVWQKKKDVVTSVLTGGENRAKSIDTLSGQVKRLDSLAKSQSRQIEDLRSEVTKSIKANRDSALDSRMQELDRQLVRLRQAQALLDERLEEVSRGPAGPDDSFVDNGKGKARKGRKERQGAGSASADSQDYNPFEKPVSAAGKTLRQANSAVAKELNRKPSDRPGKAQPSGTAGHRLSVVTERETKPKEPVKDTKEDKEAAYIPPGSILTGVVMTGGDFPTATGKQQSPLPLLIRLQKTAILPNRYTSDVRECFLLAAGHGELSSERAKLRGETISCIRRDGTILQSAFNGYVVGEDGKEGVKGRLVSKQGQMIARTLMAGFLSGLSDAFDYDPVEVLSTSSTGRVQYQKNFSGDAAKGGVAKGFSNAFEKVSDFYMDLADQMFPVVEINAGRQVDLIAIAGSRLRPVDTEHVKAIEPNTKPAGNSARHSGSRR